MTACRRYVVRGRVQGVFYRAETQQSARRLGLTGWVRNVSDGSVELVACGERTKLDELERWLWQGPPRANVDEVVASDVAPQMFDDFRIAY